MNYEKYSLDNLTEWVHDAMSSDASPHEIYSTIREAVQEDYSYHKERASHAFGLLELLSGHRPVPDLNVDDGMRPWGHSDMEYQIANSKKVTINNPWDATYSKSCDDFLIENNSQDDIFNNVFDARKNDKVLRWQLPVQLDDASEEYFIQFPDDLLEAANLKEGDQVEWIDQGDGSYLLKKVENKPMSYDEMIAAGLTMTDDGFWIKQ
jgi:hypothetical protein